MQKTSAWPLSQAYAALIVYASLYPFTGWRDQGIAPWAFLASPWPKYWTGFDIAANVCGYIPLGFLLALAFARRLRNPENAFLFKMYANGFFEFSMNVSPDGETAFIS